jgi:hypothetical protein
MMAITWASAKEEIRDILDDAVFETGGSATDYLLTWANRIQKEVHWELDFRSKLGTAEITGTTSDYYLSLPTDFLKVSNRFTKVRIDDDYIDIISLEKLNEIDPDHDSVSTTTGAQYDYVAIEGGKLWLYPMIATTLVLENYFYKPTEISASNNIDINDDQFAEDLIINGVCGKYGFPFLNEKELADEYRQRYYQLLEQYRIYLTRNNTQQLIEREYY